MVNKCLDSALYEGYGGFFSIFQCFTAYNRNRAHIKLTYKVRTFRYCYSEIGGWW